MAEDTRSDDAATPTTSDARTGERGPDSPPSITELTVDPVTRVSGGGAQTIHVELDLEAGSVSTAHTGAHLFRGYEQILEGRDPRDAVDLASRLCGDTGVVHSIAASMALEMVQPVTPPPLGLWVRNMGQAAAFLYNLAGHLFLRAGPDYSASMLSRTDPTALEQAHETSALRTSIHGYETVGDIMDALDPFEGELSYEVIQRARDVQELIALVLGKFPHPSTAAPGGVTTTLDRTMMTQYYTRLKDLADYAKTIPPIWDDLLDFMLEHVDGYASVGEQPLNLLSAGVWDDPDAYTARYADADEWGRARLSTPGAVVDGELVTTALTEIDAGIEEHVDHSFYEDWTDEGARFGTTPAGDTIGPRHPWNKRTRPAPGEAAWDGRYSWATAPRWRGTPMESGAFARQWITARADAVSHPLIEPTGDGLNLTLPEVGTPEVTLRWDIPDRLNAAERLRAEAYHLAHAGIACYVGLVETLASLKDGESSVHTPFSMPRRGTHRGVGFWESGRGIVTHHVVVEDHSLETYQMLTPSTWNASPAGPDGQPGPIEAAMGNTPLHSEPVDPEAVTGIDVLRAVRSFDPCMVCAVH